MNFTIYLSKEIWYGVNRETSNYDAAIRRLEVMAEELMLAIKIDGLKVAKIEDYKDSVSDMAALKRCKFQECNDKVAILANENFVQAVAIGCY